MTFTENMLSQYGGTAQAKQNIEGVCDNNFDTYDGEQCLIQFMLMNHVFQQFV